MHQSLFSPRWYRVKDLRPQLRAQIDLRRQEQRGVDWFLLIDEAADEVRRLNRTAYEFVGRCDGIQRVQQIWEQLLQEHPEEVMTQDDVVQLLVALHDRGLIAFDVTPDIEAIFRDRSRQRQKERLQGANPLAFRLALADPSALLAFLAPLGQRVFSAGAFGLWFAAVLAAGAAAMLQLGELSAHASRVLASPGYLFMTWLLYPVIKTVHELAHGLAVQRWGAPVRQAGVTLMMLTPVPFVNASAADRFRHRYQRAIVSAAGIMAELTIAALAMAVWLVVQPGRVQDLALLAMLIGAVSTVLVNGNPLMRFDGYYLLCDLLDLQNLSSRSTTWWTQWLAHRLLGAAPARPLRTLPGERFWLIAYAPLATLYRFSLSLGIGLWIGSHSAPLGMLVGAFMFYSTLLVPLIAALRATAGALARGNRPRAVWRGIGIGVALLASVTILPVPFSTQAQGVVWPPESAQLRAGTDGFVARYAVADGAPVKAGDLIATLADERLDVTQATLTTDATDLEVQLFQAITTDPDKVPALREKLAYSRAETARNDEKRAQLEVRALADGVLVTPHQADDLGGYRKKGELLGYLVTADPLTVRVALPQEQADLVRRGSRAVGVRVADDGYTLRSGRIQRDHDGAVMRLPSAALGERSGGEIDIDTSDKDGLATRQPVVLMDVEVDNVHSDRVGARAVVRFDHGRSPLVQQALRQLQQLVLQHFNPAA